MKHWFVNPDEGRLRAGWRILVFVVMLVGLALLGQIVARAALGGVPGDEFLRMAVLVSLVALAATITVPIARRYLDRKSFVSLGLAFDRRAVADLVFGFALSGAMAGSIFAVMVAGGLVRVTSVGLDSTAVGSLAVFGAGALVVILLLDVVVGWWEELVFRGYLLQNMIEGLGVVWAVVLSCLLYGLVHAFNPNAAVLSTAIIVLFGFLRIYGYLATKLLWLSMGMHVGWNFFQGPVFGYAASGHVSASLIVQERAGPAWLTGGEFGPEGSVLTIPVVLLALAAMRWWARRAGAEPS